MIRISKKEAQTKAWQFIRAFTDEIVGEFKEKIDFIIIYGSAARGEFVPGKSDVDILIQVFEKADQFLVQNRANELFWKIAEQYPELQFQQSLSIANNKKAGFIEEILEKIEQKSLLYVPVFVFVKGQIDWVNGKLSSDDALITIGQHLLIPQRSVFLRFKQEGIILYGRDIRKEIQVRLRLIDRFRIGAAPQVLSFTALSISPVSSQKAQNYAVKALLYQIDGLLTALDRYKKMDQLEKITENEKILLQEFTESLQRLIGLRLDYTKGVLRPSDFRLFQNAIDLKWSGNKLGYIETMLFCFKAWSFIVRSNMRSIVFVIIKQLARLPKAKDIE